MKITSLLQEGITAASSPENATNSAPQMGRSDKFLEDHVDESTSSGSVASVATPVGGMQRRGKGSIFSGIKTSAKFPNSKAVKESSDQEKTKQRVAAAQAILDNPKSDYDSRRIASSILAQDQKLLSQYKDTEKRYKGVAESSDADRIQALYDKLERFEERLGSDDPRVQAIKDEIRGLRDEYRVVGQNTANSLRGVTENSMADFFAKAAQEKFPNALVRKNGETIQEPPKREVPPPAPQAPVDVEKLKVVLANLEKKYEQLGGDSWQYADRMMDRDYEAQAVGREINRLKSQIAKASEQLDEKSKSKAQFRTMAAVANNPEFAKKVGIKQSVGKEFHKADKASNYKSLPKKVNEGEANLEKALDTLSGSWSGWYPDENQSNPDVKTYWFDDGEGGFYANGTIEHNLKTGQITVDFEDSQEGDEVKGTFNSVGDAMRALRGGYPGSHGGKAPNFDRLGQRQQHGPDDLRKTDRTGRKGTIGGGFANKLKGSIEYNKGKHGPKGMLPEAELAEEMLAQDLYRDLQIFKKGADKEIGGKAKNKDLSSKPKDKEIISKVTNMTNEGKDPCWDGYKQIGMKNKGGKKVPNCVPVKEEEVSEDWQKTNKQDKTDGMSPKAVKAYRRENPGSKLQTAVTKKPSELKAGSKDAKRRKSFCARMSGVEGPMKDEHGKPTPKAKALKRWNC